MLITSHFQPNQIINHMKKVYFFSSSNLSISKMSFLLAFMLVLASLNVSYAQSGSNLMFTDPPMTGNVVRIGAGDFLSISVPSSGTDQSYRIQRTFPPDQSYLIVTSHGGVLDIPPFQIKSAGEQVITITETGNGQFACSFKVSAFQGERMQASDGHNNLFPEGQGGPVIYSPLAESIVTIPALILNVATICSGGTLTVSVNNSDDGHTYRLQETLPPGTPVSTTGNGGTITFPAVYPVNNGAIWTVYDFNDTWAVSFLVNIVAQPTAPTLTLSQAEDNVCAGPDLWATGGGGGGGGFNCTDSYEYSTDGGITWLPYVLGTHISSTLYQIPSVKIKAIRSDAEGRSCYAENIYTWTIDSKVHDITAGHQASFCSIQQAIDASTTYDGDVIQVEAGSYVEKVIIDKALTINGSNAGLDPSAWINSPTIILPASNAPDDEIIFEVAVDNIVIDGIEFNGSNSGLGAGREIGGVQVHAANAIVNGPNSYGSYNGTTMHEIEHLDIQNSTFSNFVWQAIYLDVPYGTSKSWHYIHNNHFGNMMEGIQTYAVHAEIFDNEFNPVQRAISMHEVNTASAVGFTPGIHNNTVTIKQLDLTYHKDFAFWLNGRHDPAPAFDVADNVINCPNAFATGDTLGGFYIMFVDGTNTLTLTGNTINGNGGNCDLGVMAANLWSPNVSIVGGSFNDIGDCGVLAINRVKNWGAGNVSLILDHVTIDGTGLSGSTGVKAFVKVPGMELINVDITNNCSIGQFADGVLAEGGTASISVTDNLTTITGNQFGIRVKDGADLGPVTNNTITGNTSGGIIIESTAGTIGLINNNTISGNGLSVDATYGLGLQYSLAPLLDARNNWWGDATGPYNDPYNTCGLGNAVVGNVDLMPWLDGAGGSTVNLPIHNTSDNTWYCSIKDAIGAADQGDNIKIEVASHTEGPQIVVNKNITLLGLGMTSTTLFANGNSGSSGDPRGWILVNPGIVFNMNNLTIDGTGYNIWQGIRHKGSGTIDHVGFKNIRYEESGPSYAGTAISAFGGNALTPMNVNVTNCEFSGIGRVGVLFYGPGITASNYAGNQYTGKGSGNWLDYAVELGAGANAIITGSVVTGNLGVADVDGSNSAAFLSSTYFGPGTSGTITGCDITGNTIGIAVGIGSADASVIVASQNKVYGNTDYGVLSSGPQVDARYNWWGDVSGPAHANNPCGLGDDISDNVLYSPWKNSGSFDFDIYSLQAYALTGSSSICIGGTTEITLSGSQNGGVNFDYLYDLYTNNTLVGGSTTKIGTGGPLIWNVEPSTNTIYTAKARNSLYTCEQAMNGSATIYLGPITTAPTLDACPGMDIDIPITVTDFDQVGAISLTLNYNKNVLTYISYDDNSNLIDYFNVITPLTGDTYIIKLSGIPVPPAHIDDGLPLVTIRFHYNGGMTSLHWDNSDDTWCEYATGDPDFEPYCDDPGSDYYIDGSVAQTSLAADFMADNLFPPKFTTIQLTDLSTGGAAGWDWSFDRPTVVYDGGTNSHSPNPQVHFTDGGLYTVILTVTKPNCTATETKTGYIRAGIHGLWIGQTSTEWLTSSNWDDDLTPFNLSNVLITTSTSPTYWPKYTGALVIGDDPGAQCKKITFEGSGYMMTVKGTMTTLSNLPESTVHANSGTGNIIFELP
jgi:hypothetical protein